MGRPEGVGLGKARMDDLGGPLTPDVNRTRPLEDLFPPVFLAVYNRAFEDAYPTTRFVTGTQQISFTR